VVAWNAHGILGLSLAFPRQTMAKNHLSSPVEAFLTAAAQAYWAHQYDARVHIAAVASSEGITKEYTGEVILPIAASDGPQVKEWSRRSVNDVLTPLQHGLDMGRFIV